MEAPKYCLEAVAIWDKIKIQKNGPVKAFCAYGATEDGTDSVQIAKADAIIAEPLRKTAAAIAAAKFAAAMAQIARLN